jgi:hypothetical protein
MAKRAGSSRASRPRKSRAARLAQATDREHTLAGEAAHEIATYVLPGDVNAIADVIEGHVASPDQEPGHAERDQHTEDAVTVLAIVIQMHRHSMEQLDEDEKPFVRVVGRIIYILTIDGGRDDCTVTPIAVALLLFLREHLDPEHRQLGNSRQTINVTEPNLQGILYDRLEKLASKKWMSMLRKGATGRGYQLTENGRFVFKSWPEGIEFDPHNKDLWARKTPSRGGRASLPSRGK